MNNDEPLSLEKSAFNEGYLQLMRLNNLWNMISSHRRRGNFENWKWDLDNVWIELCTDVKEERLGKDLTDETTKKNHQTRIDVARSFQSGSRVQQYEALHNRTEFLRQLQDAAGKGGKYRDGTEELLE